MPLVLCFVFLLSGYCCVHRGLQLVEELHETIAPRKDETSPDYWTCFPQHNGKESHPSEVSDQFRIVQHGVPSRGRPSDCLLQEFCTGGPKFLHPSRLNRMKNNSPCPA